MSYTATAWVNGSTPANATNMNHLETQYQESSLSFEPDQFTAGFVISGYAASGSVGTTTVTVAAGTAYLLQSDGTTRQRKLTSSTQTTSTPTATYHLYLQPDGTWFWSTAGSGQAANSLHIADVATNGSGQISSITDARTLTASMLPNMSGALTLPAISTSSVTTTAANLMTGSSNDFIQARNGSDHTWQMNLGVSTSGLQIFDAKNGDFIFSQATINGINFRAKFTAVGNQATAGNFGVPVIVAEANNTNVAVTTDQTIVSFTPPVAGKYRVSMTIGLVGAGGATVTAKAQYHDPNLSNTVNAFLFGNDGVGTAVLSSAAMTKGRVIQCMPIIFWADGTAAIAVHYQDTTATVNDDVSVTIERLS